MRRPKGKEEKRNQSQKLWKCKNIQKRHTNGISKCESECLMNWKKLRIQFTFEFIFSSFLLDLKFCAIPTKRIHCYWKYERSQSY